MELKTVYIAKSLESLSRLLVNMETETAGAREGFVLNGVRQERAALSEQLQSLLLAFLSEKREAYRLDVLPMAGVSYRIFQHLFFHPDSKFIRQLVFEEGWMAFFYLQARSLGLVPGGTVVVLLDQGDSPNPEGHFLTQRSKWLLNLSSQCSGSAPKISICIPHHNRSERLAGLLSALLRQTQLPYEVVVLDDGSTCDQLETARQVVDEFRERLNIRFVSDFNQGAGPARNKAAQIATGTHLIFMDDDNIPERTEIETFDTAFRNQPDALITTCMYRKWETQASSIQQVYIPSGGPLSHGVFRNIFGDSNFGISRQSFLSTAGFPDQKYIGEDWTYLLEYALSGKPWHVVPLPLYTYVQHPEQYSEYPANRRQSQQIGLEKRARLLLKSEEGCDALVKALSELSIAVSNSCDRSEFSQDFLKDQGGGQEQKVWGNDQIEIHRNLDFFHCRNFGNDPQILLRPQKDTQPMELSLEIFAPRDLIGSLYYSTKNSSSFPEALRIQFDIASGFSIHNIPLSHLSVLGPLRLDIGEAEDEYWISRLHLWSARRGTAEGQLERAKNLLLNSDISSTRPGIWILGVPVDLDRIEIVGAELVGRPGTLKSLGSDPNLIIAVLGEQPKSQYRYLLSAVVESSEASDFRLYWSVESKPSFTEQMAESCKISSGKSRFCFQIISDEPVKWVRLDPLDRPAEIKLVSVCFDAFG